MFGKKQHNGSSRNGPLLTVMGETARLEGKFNIADSIQVECEVAGEINVDGKLVIGEKGVVHADVHTMDALIMGRYEGNMVATGIVEITSTGRVNGNVETDSLMISKGGFFNGNVIKIQRGEIGQRAEVVQERRSSGPALIDQRLMVKK